MKKSGHLMPVPEIRHNLTDDVSNSTPNLMTEISDWTPTKKQAAFLDALAKIGLNRSVRAVCKEAECTTASYYVWIKQAGFSAACREVASQILQTAVPMTLSAMGQKAGGGDTSAARLILQTAGMIGSGGADVHIGDRIKNQLNQYSQQPGQQGYGDHRDIVFRAKNMEEFEICKEVGEGVAAEMLEREERGEPPLTSQQHLLAIKLGTEKVIAERAAKKAASEAAETPVIDITSVEHGEAD